MPHSVACCFYRAYRAFCCTVASLGAVSNTALQPRTCKTRHTGQSQELSTSPNRGMRKAVSRGASIYLTHCDSWGKKSAAYLLQSNYPQTTVRHKQSRGLSGRANGLWRFEASTSPASGGCDGSASTSTPSRLLRGSLAGCPKSLQPSAPLKPRTKHIKRRAESNKHKQQTLTYAETSRYFKIQGLRCKLQRLFGTSNSRFPRPFPFWNLQEWKLYRSFQWTPPLH